MKHLNIRSILVPVRKAPPAPKSTVNRPNFNLDDAWGDSNIPGTLHINAANPLYITTNVSLTNANVGIHPVINQWESRNKVKLTKHLLTEAETKQKIGKYYEIFSSIKTFPPKYLSKVRK